MFRFWMLVLTTIAGLLSSQVKAEDWPQFRGKNASGVSTESTDLPAEFSLDKNVRWSLKLGEGIASPIISNGRLIITTMVNPEKFAVLCLNAKSGEEIWRREFDTGPLPSITPPNTPASSTPSTDGKLVYVYFSTLGLMAFEMEDGELAWQHPVQQPFYFLGWGAAASPVIYKDIVLFNQDDDLDPFLLALDKETGTHRWRTPRPEMLAGYAVPVICKAAGREDIVIAGSGKLKGYDPDTGKQLWNCNTLLRTIMTTPVVQDDRIYVSLQSYGDTDRVLRFALLQWKDTNQDGRLEKSELNKAFWKKFDKGDSNKDGFLVDSEIDVAFQAPTNMVGGGTTIQAIRGGGSGDVTATNVIFNLDNTAPSNIASPLVVKDQLFLVKKGGISASFHPVSGDTQWIRKRLNNFGNYYASPVAGDGKIYVMGENGFLVVIEQGPELKILAKNDMGDSCIATPAIADNCIYVRTLNSLYCFSKDAE